MKKGLPVAQARFQLISFGSVEIHRKVRAPPMSAKISVIVYILICLEVGVLLAYLPWSPFWYENFFLSFMVNKLHASWIVPVIQSGYVKGAVTALGAVNILAGLRDIFKFRESVSQLSDMDKARVEAVRFE